MKYLVVGGGSMGKRRVRCLLACGVDATQIRVVDPRADRLEECESKYKVAGLPDLSAGLKWEPTACLVSVAGERATQVCSTLLQAGKHVFCEAPMGVNVEETQLLGKLAQQHDVLVAAGAQTPFHPLVKQCRDWVNAPSFGKPLIFNLEWGQYLPGWHPYEAVSAFYSPAHLLAVMNLELVQLYFITDDRITELKSSRRNVSSINVAGGDVFQSIGRTQNGMAVSLLFDLIQRPARSIARFASEKGTIELDFSANHVRRYLVETKEWETTGVPEGYSYEQCYIDEINHFLHCVQGKAIWHNPLTQAIDVSRCIQSMEASGAEADAST